MRVRVYGCVNIYIYIYVCVCVCVCVIEGGGKKKERGDFKILWYWYCGYLGFCLYLASLGRLSDFFQDRFSPFSIRDSAGF